MEKLKGKVLIAQAGGPTAVINQSLVGAVLESRKFGQITKVYGALKGVEGIVNENFIDLTKETTNNLEKVDWSISTETVVIAHAGTYGHEPEEVENNILPRINKMLNRYDNLMVDISGIGSNILIQILKNVDYNRILFGSDALYNVQWLSIVVLLYTLEKVYKKVEEHFLQIVSLNPLKYILKKEVKIK